MVARTNIPGSGNHQPQQKGRLQKMSPQKPLPRMQEKSLAVRIRKELGRPTDWLGTKDDMLKVIEDLDEPRDAAPAGAFAQANGLVLRTMHAGNKDAWSEVMRGLRKRERELKGSEP